MIKKLGILMVLTAALAAIAAGSGAAATGENTTYLCYSTHQVNPGVWSQSTAVKLMKQGYWLPYAEKSQPTQTQLPNGWYLRCNLTQKVVEGVSQVATYVDETGHRIIDPYLLKSIDPADGYYPMAP